MINPTYHDLNGGWYKCNETIANFLVNIKGIPFIYQKDGNYYFVRTKELKEAIENIPARIMFLDWILNKF